MESNTDTPEDIDFLLSDYAARGGICFTGFKEDRKQLLQIMAEEMGFRVIGRVTEDVILLVTGITAGPKKIQKAKSLKIKIIDEVSFITIASTAGVTMDSAKEKSGALKKGELHPDDARDTQNMKVCPHCKNLIIPAPLRMRQCPFCSKGIIPLSVTVSCEEDADSGEIRVMSREATIEEYIKHLEGKNARFENENAFLKTELHEMRKRLKHYQETV